MEPQTCIGQAKSKTVITCTIQKTYMSVKIIHDHTMNRGEHVPLYEENGNKQN